VLNVGREKHAGWPQSLACAKRPWQFQGAHDDLTFCLAS
jgi:hypothetical protein